MTKFVSLREMVETMSYMKDDEVFRWYQTSFVSPVTGQIHPGETLCVTMGQVRNELGIFKP